MSEMRPDRDKFRITTRAIVFNENDEVLILEHARKDAWTFPGGHLDHGEQVNQAVIRELKEETNIDGEVLTPIDIFIHKKKCIVFFLIDMITDDIELSDEHKDYKWVSLDEMKQYNLDNEKIIDRANIALKIRTMKHKLSSKNDAKRFSY